MGNDQSPSQAETLRQSKQKAMLLLAEYENNAVGDQLALAEKQKIRGTSELVSDLRVAQFQLNEAFNRDEVSAVELADKTKIVRELLNQFSQRLEHTRTLRAANDEANARLVQYKQFAFPEQIQIATQERIPVSDQLIRDLRNTYLLLSTKLRNPNTIPIEIEAITNRMVSLMRRFSIVIRDHEEDDDEIDKKRSEAIGQANILLRAYENWNKQGELSLTKEESKSLTETVRRQILLYLTNTTVSAAQLSDSVKSGHSVLVIRALTIRLQERLGESRKKVKAVRDEVEDRSSFNRLNKSLD